MNPLVCQSCLMLPLVENCIFFSLFLVIGHNIFLFIQLGLLMIDMIILVSFSIEVNCKANREYLLMS